MPEPTASGNKNGATDENVSRFLPKYPMLWAAAGDAPNASTATAHASSTVRRTVPRARRKGAVDASACTRPLGRCARLAQRSTTSCIDLNPSTIENYPRKSIHHRSNLGFATPWPMREPTVPCWRSCFTARLGQSLLLLPEPGQRLARGHGVEVEIAQCDGELLCRGWRGLSRRFRLLAPLRVLFRDQSLGFSPGSGSVRRAREQHLGTVGDPGRQSRQPRHLDTVGP